MPTCSLPIGLTVSCRVPSPGEATADPPASAKSANLSICPSRGSSGIHSSISERNETRCSNAETPQTPEAAAAAGRQVDARSSWAPKRCDLSAFQSRQTTNGGMASSTTESAAGLHRRAQRKGSRKAGKGEQLSRAANKEWLISLRTKLDSLLGGGSSLRKTQTSPPFGFRFRNSAKTLFKHDSASGTQDHQENGPYRLSSPPGAPEQQPPQKQAQVPCRQPQHLVQQHTAVKHWFESADHKSPPAVGRAQLVSRSPSGQGASGNGGKTHEMTRGDQGRAPHKEASLGNPGGLPPIPLLEAAAKRFELDSQLRAQQPFLGMEENDAALQRLLSNYYTLRLSPLQQEVSLRLVMLSPHLAVFLGPENKPLLRLSALTNVKVFLLGASIEDSQRNTRYSDKGNPIHCPSREGESDKLRLAELRGTIDAVLAAYAHLAYRLQHPWRKAVAYCVYEALTAGQRVSQEGQVSCAEERTAGDCAPSSAAAGFADVIAAGPARDAAASADSNATHLERHAETGDTRDALNADSSTHWSAKNLELVKRLLDMPPVMCEAPQIVQGVVVENAPVRPLCIPQIARDEVWVLPLP